MYHKDSQENVMGTFALWSRREPGIWYSMRDIPGGCSWGPPTGPTNFYPETAIEGLREGLSGAARSINYYEDGGPFTINSPPLRGILTPGPGGDQRGCCLAI